MINTKQREIRTYDFERYGETRHGFIIKFNEINGERMFVTNSKDAIDLFVPVLEYAEAIQDKGVDYEITSSVILFSTEAGAAKAAEHFLSIIESTNNVLTSNLIYTFNKSKYFGKRRKFILDIAARFGTESDAVSEEDLESEFDIYAAAIEGGMTAYYNGREYKIVSYDIRSGNLIASDGSALEATECDITC